MPVGAEKDSARYWLDQAVSRYKAGLPDQALVAVDRALALNPSSAEAYYIRGTILAGQNKYGPAIDDFSKAVSLNPVYADAYNARGKAFCGGKYFNRGLYDFNRAIDLDQYLADAYLNRAGIWYKKGDLERAEADYSRAVKLDPDQAEVLNNRGAVLAEERRIQPGDFRLHPGLRTGSRVHHCLEQPGIRLV